MVSFVLHLSVVSPGQGSQENFESPHGAPALGSKGTWVSFPSVQQGWAWRQQSGSGSWGWGPPHQLVAASTLLLAFLFRLSLPLTLPLPSAVE